MYYEDEIPHQHQDGELVLDACGAGQEFAVKRITL